MEHCHFCGTENPENVHRSCGHVFCNVGPTGHSCWSQYVQYAERGLPTPYEQEQENANEQR